MPEYLNNVSTLNTYDPSTQLGPSADVAIINFSVLGQPALAQFWKPIPEQPGKWALEGGQERLFVANTFGAFAQRVAGVRFRSAITNTPAQIVAEMAFATDPIIQGGSLASVSITGSGQVTPVGGAVLTGIVAANGTITAGTGFTVNHAGTGTYAITFTTPFAASPVVLVTLNSGNARVATIQSLSASGVTVLTNGGVTDEIFNFTATPVA